MRYTQTECPHCGRVTKRKTPQARMLTYRGKTLSLRQWAGETGLAHTTISRRLRAGMSTKQALTAPKGTHNGCAA